MTGPRVVPVRHDTHHMELGLPFCCQWLKLHYELTWTKLVLVKRGEFYVAIKQVGRLRQSGHGLYGP